jgi:uncharacterized protein YjbJ (UPF0337 family)
MTDEQENGQWDQAKGEVKEDVGKVTGDRSTEVSGKLDQVKGDVEKEVGDARESMREGTDRDR